MKLAAWIKGKRVITHRWAANNEQTMLKDVPESDLVFIAAFNAMGMIDQADIYDENLMPAVVSVNSEVALAAGANGGYVVLGSPLVELAPIKKRILKYCNHDDECPANPACYSGPCECGLAAAVKEIGEDPEHWGL